MKSTKRNVCFTLAISNFTTALWEGESEIGLFMFVIIYHLNYSVGLSLTQIQGKLSVQESNIQKLIIFPMMMHLLHFQ